MDSVMNPEDRWIAVLGDLKTAMLRHADEMTRASDEAYSTAIKKFTLYVKANQGIVRGTKENLEVIEYWNAFVEAAQTKADPKGPANRLLDAIDRAMGASYEKRQSTPSVTYNVGVAGVLSTGANAHVHHVEVTQHAQGGVMQINLHLLAEDLSRLRAAMRAEASTMEQDGAVGAVAEAEIAARAGDLPSSLLKLKKAGKWAFDIATRIGVEVATSALKMQLGLPK